MIIYLQSTTGLNIVNISSEKACNSMSFLEEWECYMRQVKWIHIFTFYCLFKIKQ